MVPVAPVTTGVTFAFRFHVCSISISWSSFFKIFSTSFYIKLLLLLILLLLLLLPPPPLLLHRMLYLDAPLFVYWGSKCCPSVLDITGMRGLHRNFRNSSLFTATCKTSQSAKRISAANHLCNNEGIVRKRTTRLLAETWRATVGRTPLNEWSVRRRGLWQHTTITTDKHPCPGWDSKPQSQQASGRRPVP